MMTLTIDQKLADELTDFLRDETHRLELSGYHVCVSSYFDGTTDGHVVYVWGQPLDQSEEYITLNGFRFRPSAEVRELFVRFAITTYNMLKLL
jgi:hypothetical protein